MTAAITFDVDWAPDCAIELTASILIEHGIKSTWFVTHQSPAIEKLRTRPELFELGIHPNFMQGSSHGEQPSAVLDHCMALVPDAVSMRSHGLMLSSNLLEIIISTTPILLDLSIFLPLAQNLEAVEYWRFGRPLTRVPYVWEDDYIMGLDRRQSHGLDNIWDANAVLLKGRGIKIFNFHPIHVFLNSSSVQGYDALKRVSPDLKSLRLADARKFVNKARPGVGSCLRGLASKLATSGTVFAKDLLQ